MTEPNNRFKDKLSPEPKESSLKKVHHEARGQTVADSANQEWFIPQMRLTDTFFDASSIALNKGLVRLATPSSTLLANVSAISSALGNVAIAYPEDASSPEDTEGEDDLREKYRKRREAEVRNTLKHDRNCSVYETVQQLAETTDDEWVGFQTIVDETDFSEENVSKSLEALLDANLVWQTFMRRRDSDEHAFFQPRDVPSDFKLTIAEP